MLDYQAFLESRRQFGEDSGFEPLWMPDFLFDFQDHLVDWGIRKGRAAILAGTGLGKTPMALVWAQNVVQKTNKRVILLTPLAVTHQFEREAEKFGIEAKVSRDGNGLAPITITNYERLGYFNRNDFVGLVCDEAGCLKDFDSVRKKDITEFCRKMPYRLLDTATAAPNDYNELGTSSEALGYLGYQDMLTKFFKQEQKGGQHGWARMKYRFRGHAEKPFWRWICSWARACRMPSDLGYSDDEFILPPLNEREVVVKCSRPLQGRLFQLPARGLDEQREERRATIKERSEKVAELVDTGEPAICWVHLNDEGDMLEKIIPDALQVSGSMTDDKKEGRLVAFSKGDLRVLIIKPKIGAWGMNWQHCNNICTYTSHSFEQDYQLIRRCWRYGQTRPVTVNRVVTEGEGAVIKNLQRKQKQADEMFDSLVLAMSNELRIDRDQRFNQKEIVPSWL